MRIEIIYHEIWDKLWKNLFLIQIIKTRVIFLKIIDQNLDIILIFLKLVNDLDYKYALITVFFLCKSLSY